MGTQHKEDALRKRHLVIPDTQVKPGAPLGCMTWAGRAILEYRPDVVIHIGDHWDMSSLNSYDSPLKMEKRRLIDDVKAGNDAMRELLRPLREYQRKHKRFNQYSPRLIFCMGNHENRIARTIEKYPQILDGFVSTDILKLDDWEVQDFLTVIQIDGINYSHYFYNPDSGRPFGGTIENRLKNIGASFTQGHQQGLRYGIKPTVTGKTFHGLVCGSYYQHCEEYRGPQATNEWRGIVIKNEVQDGNYDIMPLSMDYLRRRFA